MKRFVTFALILIFAFVFAWTIPASAQTGGMSGNQNTMSGKSDKNSKESSDQEHFSNMMTGMDNHYMIMMGRFDSLQQDFDRMMKMNNMSEIRAAMRNHAEMMTDMRNSMMQQRKMWGQAMSMMESMGMMGSGQMKGSEHMMGSDHMMGSEHMMKGSDDDSAHESHHGGGR